MKIGLARPAQKEYTTVTALDAAVNSATRPRRARREYEMYWVDIPKEPKDQSEMQEYKNVGRFETLAEAVAFAKEKFGADNEGNINLIARG